MVAEGSVTELRDMIKESGASLEEIFLRVSDQEEDVSKLLSNLKEAFNGNGIP